MAIDREAQIEAMQRAAVEAPSGWQDVHVLFKRTLIDGTRAGGRLMRRRDGAGNWVYRRMTADEEREYVSTTAW